MGSRLKVLVVEDARQEAPKLIDTLRTAGIDSESAEVMTGEPMLDTIGSRPWDLLVVGRESARTIVRALHHREERVSEEIVRQSQRFLEEGQAIAHIGSWVAGLHDQDALWCSAEFYRILGLDPAESMSVERFLSMVHPADLAAVRATSEAAIDDGPDFEVVHRIVRADGAIRVVHQRAVVIRDDDGVALRLVGTVQDVTERFRSQERERFLSRASAVLGAAPLAFPELLPTVARLGVPAFADGCVVQLSADDRSQVAAAHRVPDQESSLRRWWTGNGDPPPARTVMATGQPRWSRSYLCVPLRARGHVVGALTFVSDDPDREFDGFDLATAEDLAGRVAFAVDNARLYETARQSVRARDEFLTLVAHELKTPITPLRLQLRGLRRSVARLPEADRPTLAAIERAAARLERLVDRLVDVSELTATPLALHRRPTLLAAAARSALDGLRGELERAGSPVTLRIDRPISGAWDRPRLEQALTNLLTNAIKYGPCAPIEVVVGGDDDSGWVSVRDHGMGMAAEEQVSLFGRFERRVPVRNFGGLGVGLWVAYEIAVAHGGRIDLWSEPGEGARFTLVLPRRPQEPR